jgi:ankyrin repeat protein
MTIISDRPVHQKISASIREQDLVSLKKLIDAYPDFLYFDGLGGWLNYAARTGSLDIIEFLLKKGVDVNKGDFEGVAPLCSAASRGDYNIVKYLLDNGAKMDVSASVRNPLFAAISASVQVNATQKPPTGEAPQIVQLLLERGIDSTVRYNSKTMTNMDALAFAMMWGARDLARILALWNAQGNEAIAQAALEQADKIAEANTVPVPKGELVKPS